MLELGLQQLLIVCPLVFIAGFVDATAGGGGLISLPAYFIAGFPAHQAIGTYKLSTAMGTAVTTFRFWRNGYIPYKIAAFCVIAALAGGTCGAKLTLLVDDAYLTILMAIVLPIVALYLVFGKGLSHDKPPYRPAKTIAIGCVVSFAIGVYDGFYGGGAGMFMILLFHGLGHMSLKQSNGTAKVANLATNVSSLVVFLSNGVVMVGFGLIAGMFGIAGNYIGSRTFDRNAARIAKPIMLVVIAIFLVRVASKLMAL